MCNNDREARHNESKSDNLELGQGFKLGLPILWHRAQVSYDQLMLN